MLTIPPAVANLLKSKMMVGENRPTGTLQIDGAPGGEPGDALPIRPIRMNGDYKESEETIPTNQWYGGNWSNGFVCELPSGKILVSYRNEVTNDHYLSLVPSWDELLGGNNRAAKYEYVFKTGNPSYQIPFVAPHDGEVYLLDIQFPWPRVDPTIPVEINLYKSPDKGLSQTWTWQALLYQKTRPYTEHPGYTNRHPGQILISENDIVVVFTSIIDRSGYEWGTKNALYSRDGGVTWAVSTIYDRTGLGVGSVDYADTLPSVWKMGSRYYVTHYALRTPGYWLISYSDDLANWTSEPKTSEPRDFFDGGWNYHFCVLGDSKNLYLFVNYGGTTNYIRPISPAIVSGADFADISKWTKVDPGVPWAQSIDDWWVRSYVSPREDYHFLLEQSRYAGGRCFATKGFRGTDPTSIRPKNIVIDRTKGSASQATVVLDNKNGIYSPDKLGEWNKVLWLNKEIAISLGYGAEQPKVFTGLIDEIQMSAYPAELTITARDMSKRALDQQPQRTVDGITSYALLFENTTPEAIFAELATMAGWDADKVHADATGVTIASIQLGHESIADCFQRLAELVCWEWLCDENGRLYFRAAKDPEAAAVYEFTEGVDIFSINYRISDAELYRTVVVWASDENGGVVKASTTWAAADYNNLLPLRTLIINAADLTTTQEGCQAIADAGANALTPKVREVDFVVVGNPYLQIGDVVKVKETTTTISELYRILEISHQMDAEGSPVFATSLRCYHFGSEEV